MKKYIRDSKMRSQLKGAAMTIEPVLSIGKNSLTPEFIDAVRENIVKNELIKINILKNCDDDANEIAYTLAAAADDFRRRAAGTGRLRRRCVHNLLPDHDFGAGGRGARTADL